MVTRRVVQSSLLLAFTVACGVALPPVVVTPPTPQPPTPPVVVVPPAAETLAFDVVACRGPFKDNYCDGPAVAVFKIHTGTNPDTYLTLQGDGNGYAWASGVPNVPDSDITITAPGYEVLAAHISPPTLAATNAKGVHNVWALQSAHVDPSAIPLPTLAAIRGAMWPQTQGACGNLSIGPRPGDPTNIFATVFLTEYSKAEADCMLRELHEVRGYTTAVAGPLVDSDGYHGVWQPNDWRTKWDAFLDMLQVLWDAHLAPVVFLHPDGWTFEQTRDQLTPLLLQPRAQRLIRIAVGSGWEPAGYDWSSCTWTLYAQWVRTTLPNALSLIHNQAKDDGSPYDAPVGTDKLCDDNGKPNGAGWTRIAPYLHGFLIQYGPFSGKPTDAANVATARAFAAQYTPNGVGADEHGFRWHFVNGEAGWPQGSAWGQTVPLMLYYGEGTAYNRFWRGMQEADGLLWGDLAMQGGADGYLDGGTVPVPVTVH